MLSPNTIADLNSVNFQSDPLCLLPPELAFQHMVPRYISVGTLAAFVWDILSNIFNDYKLLFKHRIRLPTIVYFISRVCCLGLIVGYMVFQAVPVHTCNGVGKALSVIFSGAIVSTSLLFFFRIQAVFDKNLWVVIFFAGLLVASLAGCLVTIVGVGGIDIGQTGYCINGQIKPFAAAAAIIPLINDTLVFLAIVWRLSYNSYVHRTPRVGIRLLIFGDYLPAFSKAILKDGQAYYLTTIAVNLITIIMLFNLSVPDDLRSTFMIPNVALMNMMACRVFRNLRLGFFKETQISTSLIARELDARRTTTPLPLWQEGSDGRVRQAGDAIFNIDGAIIPQTAERGGGP